MVERLGSFLGLLMKCLGVSLLLLVIIKCGTKFILLSLILMPALQVSENFVGSPKVWF